ncbi:MAG: Crp/Fnr family transcriptional regulator [Paramuribaculum sp.]|nr:Crp/Fnr family transcriptional regulator [Paramuribaculum sp.]
MDNMYDTLLSLPLFKGVSFAQVFELIGNSRFHFLKYLTGEKIVDVGEPCTHIKFIVSGKVRSTIANSDGRFRVSQTLTAPEVISPEYLFGLSPFYPCSVTALETTGIMQITKNDYMRMLSANEIFLYNYTNLLSMKAQKAVDGILAVTAGSLEERIAFWIASLSSSGGTDIALTCRQRDLYSLFGVQRSSFVSTLEGMRSRGLITFDHHEIRVVSRRDLLDLLSTPTE